MHEWTHKALVGTFMRGFKAEIADGIQMFKPKSLKEAISLARMRDEQLVRQRKVTLPFDPSIVDSLYPTKFQRASPRKKLTWDEIRNRRTQGLYFNCDKKFILCHRCKGSTLLLLEGTGEEPLANDNKP